MYRVEYVMGVVAPASAEVSKCAQTQSMTLLLRSRNLRQAAMAMHDVRLSKTLSWLLRHQAAKEGLDMQHDGFVPCEQVVSFLSARSIPGMTMQQLLNEVRACPKRRLELSPDHTQVRAVHGHSIRELDDARVLVEITDADTVIDARYGISFKQWETVKTEGLRCGTRNHLHIATRNSKSGYVIGKPGGDADVLVYLDIASAMKDGVKFFLAPNGVVLTRGVHQADAAAGSVIPPKYFTRAVLCNHDGSFTPFFRV